LLTLMIGAVLMDSAVLSGSTVKFAKNA